MMQIRIMRSAGVMIGIHLSRPPRLSRVGGRIRRGEFDDEMGGLRVGKGNHEPEATGRERS
jgi:hypothetical protein